MMSQCNGTPEPMTSGKPATDAPVVSVLLPVWNSERYIDECIRSILSQEGPSFELIAVDDEATDSTPAILAEHASRDARLRVVRQKNGGQVSALNHALRLARGRFVAVMNNDDVCLPGRLRRQSDFLAAREDYVLVGGASRIIDGDSRETGETIRPPSEWSRIRDILRHNTPFVAPAVMIRTDVLRAIGGWRNCFRDAEDFDLSLRLAERGRMTNLADAVLLYRRHGQQQTNLTARRQVLAALGALASARRRRMGQTDPAEFLSDRPRLTEGDLEAWGVSRRRRELLTIGGLADRAEMLMGVGEHSIRSALIRELADIRMSAETAPDKSGRIAWLTARSSATSGRRLDAAGHLLDAVVECPRLWFGALQMAWRMIRGRPV